MVDRFAFNGRGLHKYKAKPVTQNSQGSARKYVGVLYGLSDGTQRAAQWGEVLNNCAARTRGNDMHSPAKL